MSVQTLAAERSVEACNTPPAVDWTVGCKNVLGAHSKSGMDAPSGDDLLAVTRYGHRLSVGDSHNKGCVRY